ncbi:MAG TPA: sigma-70 family RNA polymerase sigma factor [Solirubrobacteraceae bacterium]|jgi:RNA polymerase sigma factor (sigma-70 family)|nr:sigma-70 family RNA polymerase sigma factor [Solirubrobacteraceae bacterium]
MLRLQSDERLIALTRRGHHAAFEVLCARYQSRLLSFCRHMLSSKEDAEDVLQEVFAAAFNAVLADDRPINVRPWLYRIARNRSLNHLRRNTAQGVDSMDIHFAENGISTSDKVMRRESFRELIADVHDLPETQRTALLLREIDAMSYEQIAQAMETTVPSVKSLLVRARISLAEAAEARRLSCDEVRLELGEVAEGLTKISTAARRHVRGCDRCAAFKKQLRENNHALAAIMPVAPLLMLKKLILTKLGSTASAGGAHAAGASATVGAGATVGAAAGGSSLAGGLMTAGAGALATKAAAGLAAAAIVAAGAVAADHAVVPARHRHHSALTASANTASHQATEPVVTHVLAQPTSAGAPAAHAARHAGRRHHATAKKAAVAPVPTVPVATVPAAETPAAPKTETPATPTAPEQVTEVTTETTQLPTSATTTEASPPLTTPTTPTPPTTTTAPEATAPPVVTTPVAPTAEAPVVTVPRRHHRERATSATTTTDTPAAPSTPQQRALLRAARRGVTIG